MVLNQCVCLYIHSLESPGKLQAPCTDSLVPVIRLHHILLPKIKVPGIGPF